MVNLYTDKKYVKGDVITDNEAFFDRYITAKSIDETGRGYLEQIDGARILDDELGTVRTPLGTTILENISTGAKTVLNLLYLQKNNKAAAVDVTECGANALDAVFTLIDNNDGAVRVVLSHAETYKCKDRDYCVNGERIAHDAAGLCSVLMEALEEQNGHI